MNVMINPVEQWRIGRTVLDHRARKARIVLTRALQNHEQATRQLASSIARIEQILRSMRNAHPVALANLNVADLQLAYARIGALREEPQAAESLRDEHQQIQDNTQRALDTAHQALSRIGRQAQELRRVQAQHDLHQTWRALATDDDTQLDTIGLLR